MHENSLLTKPSLKYISTSRINYSLVQINNILITLLKEVTSRFLTEFLDDSYNYRLKLCSFQQVKMVFLHHLKPFPNFIHLFQVTIQLFYVEKWGAVCSFLKYISRIILKSVLYPLQSYFNLVILRQPELAARSY